VAGDLQLADIERGQEMSYTIEATGLDGWMAYSYQFKVGPHDYFGYAESESE
jgi:hypothetical protein